MKNSILLILVCILMQSCNSHKKDLSQITFTEKYDTFFGDIPHKFNLTVSAKTYTGYYESESEEILNFNDVNYSLTKWNDGENLNDVDDFKEKLITAYNGLADLLKDEKYSEFVEKIRIREKNMATSMYLSSSESNARINSLIEDAKNGFIVMPFPQDTILRFYGYGKLATFKKLNGEPAFYLYNKETQEELMIDQMFYIPKGKTELEII